MTFNPYQNPGNFNPYQQLDALRQQIAQPYQQPYMPQQQMQQQQQMPNFQLLIQQEIQRQLSGMVPQQAPALMPPAQPPGVAILSAIGGVLTQNDQLWLSGNLNGLPGFFNTADGRELIQLAIAGYKRHMGVPDE